MTHEDHLGLTIETIARHLAESEHIVAFTGAGIPDFRGPDGVWTRRDAGLPAPRWRVPPGRIRPNPSHLALVELHGNGQLMRCLGCDRQYPRQEVGWDTSRWGTGYRTQEPVAGQPSCPDCGGRLISSVVNFGDPLPERELALAGRHARRCDLMLVLGSSLVVEPAASLVGRALRSGARVVLVNRGETPYDEAVALRVWAGIAEVIPPAVEQLGRSLGEQPKGA